MARILAIDYGTKRCGIAVTDTMQLIASGLETVPTEKLLEFLETYFSTEDVEKLVIGEPRHADGNLTAIAPEIEKFIKKIKEQHIHLEIDRQEEGFSSVEAKEVILKSGIKKKRRRDKSLVDKVSAVIILQRYLEEHRTI